MSKAKRPKKTRRVGGTWLSDAEWEVLAFILRELRHAAAIRMPVEIMLDPHVCSDGVNVHVTYNLGGTSFEVVGPIERRRQPTVTARIARRAAEALKER